MGRWVSEWCRVKLQVSEDMEHEQWCEVKLKVRSYSRNCGWVCGWVGGWCSVKLQVSEDIEHEQWCEVKLKVRSYSRELWGGVWVGGWGVRVV